jgi:hypothetical protein
MLFLAAWGCSAPGEKSFRLEDCAPYGAIPFQVCDLQGDGIDELILTVGQHVYLKEWDRDHLILREQLTQDRGWVILGTGRVDGGDSTGQLVVITLLRPDSLKLQAYRTVQDHGLSLHRTIVVEREVVGGRLSDRGPYPWDADALWLGTAPGDGPSAPCLVALSAGFSRQPRGIAAFGPDNKMIWQRFIGPCLVEPVAVIWSERPEETRVVFGGAGYSNGACASGLCDSIAVVAAVDGNGNLAWATRVGGAGSAPRILVDDLDGDGTREVIVASEEETATPGSPAWLRILDLKTGSVQRERRITDAPSGLAVATTAGRRGKHLALLTRDKTLSIFDARLDPVVSRRAAELAAGGDSPFLVDDLDSDGDFEIYAGAVGESSLEVLDGRLRQLTAIHLAQGKVMHLGAMRIAPREKLLLIGSPSRELCIYRPIVDPLAPFRPALWVLGVAATLIAATWGLRRLGEPLGFTWPARSLVASLALVRHGERTKDGRSQEPLTRLLAALRTCARVEDIPVGRAILEDWAKQYWAPKAPMRLLGMVPPLIGPAICIGRAPDAFRLVVRGWVLRSAVGRAMSEVAALSSGDSAANACRRASHAVERFEESLRRLNRCALRAPSADPYQEAIEAAASLRERFLAAGVILQEIHVTGQVGGRAFITAGSLRRTLRDMLVNAMEACEGSAEPSVSVRIIFGERKIVVAIEDNGRGLRSEDFERVFHGHSTKVPAGGLGLSAARRAIEAHSGRIQVRESAPWERTVFELELHRSTA